jgi:hypothetical protein
MTEDHSLSHTNRHKLWNPLGGYISIPHKPDVWFVSKTLSSLFLKVDTGGHDVYTMNQTPHATRYGTTYTYSHHTSPCWPQLTHEDFTKIMMYLDMVLQRNP